MKMGSFLLGGIIGASAVIYFSRNKGNANALFQAMPITGMNKAWKEFRNRTSSDRNDDRDDVKQMIDKNPELKTAYDEIMEEDARAH